MFYSGLDYSYSCSLHTQKRHHNSLFRVSNACHLASIFALITGRDKKKGTENRPVESSSTIGVSLLLVTYTLREYVVQSCAHTLPYIGGLSVSDYAFNSLGVKSV